LHACPCARTLGALADWCAAVAYCTDAPPQAVV
jgi:hypothetical protein